MKKIAFTLAALLLSFGLTAAAFAADGDPVAANTNEGDKAGQAIELTDGTNTLILNFSPSVNALYNGAGDDGNVQWYAVATYHAGGTQFYGSSSDSTVVYKKPRATAEKFADAVVPDAKAGDDETPDTIWTSKDWTK
jgi:hypothetical protein